MNDHGPAALARIARQVAEELGFALTGDPTTSGIRDRADISDEAGRVFILRFSERGDRLEVRGLLPRARSLHRPRPRAITVAVTRPPAAIARDIRGRFLPGFVAVWDEFVARIRLARSATGLPLAALVAAAGDEVSVRDCGDEWVVSSQKFKFRVTPTRIILERTFLSPAEAVTLAEAFAARAAQPATDGPAG